jgi:hypothetical protein
VLGAIRYQPNHAVLHTDAAVLPQRRSAWAAWNYQRAAASERESGRVCLHYLLNKLQPLPWEQPVVVSLNPVDEIQRSQVMAEYDYDHPVLDLAAIRAPAEVPALQGQAGHLVRGAWMGYGFHEDGLKAGLAAAEGLRALSRRSMQWRGRRHERSAAGAVDGLRRGAPCAAAPGAQRLRLPDLFPDAADARDQGARAGSEALAFNRRAALSFHDVDHGDGRTPAQGGALAWLDDLLAAHHIARRHRRSLAALLPARVRLHLQAGELLVLPHGRRRTAGHRGRGEQHLRRAPLLSAGPPGLRPGAQGHQGFPRLAVLPGQRRLPLSLLRRCRVRAHRGAHRPRQRLRPAAADQRERRTRSADGESQRTARAVALPPR